MQDDELDYEGINNAYDLQEFLEDKGAFNIDIIYYSKAMEYLRENDNSLRESLEIASEYGFELENINSETLASLHASHKAREDFWSIEEDINNILNK
jgi:intracellular sulfur oxidation DsrE/DsrF family protein